MGLWLLQESMRTWAEAGDARGPRGAARGRGGAPGRGPGIDPDDPVFLPPGDMPARIDACARADRAAAAADAAALVRMHPRQPRRRRSPGRSTTPRGCPGATVEVVHLVGGGARNALLCQLTADACGRPVVAGPVEATAMGNVLVQARAHGCVDGRPRRRCGRLVARDAAGAPVRAAAGAAVAPVGSR